MIATLSTVSQKRSRATMPEPSASFVLFMARMLFRKCPLSKPHPIPSGGGNSSSSSGASALERRPAESAGGTVEPKARRRSSGECTWTSHALGGAPQGYAKNPGGAPTSANGPAPERPGTKIEPRVGWNRQVGSARRRPRSAPHPAFDRRRILFTAAVCRPCSALSRVCSSPIAVATSPNPWTSTARCLRLPAEPAPGRVSPTVPCRAALV